MPLYTGEKGMVRAVNTFNDTVLRFRKYLQSSAQCFDRLVMVGVDCLGQRLQTGMEVSGNPYAVLPILMTLATSCLMPYILIEASSEHYIDELHSITYPEDRFLFFINFAQQGKLEICPV